MHRFITLGFLAAFALLLGACASTSGGSSAATATVPQVEVTARSLNIRAEPSTGGAVVGSLAQGARVAAPKPAAEGWLYIESGDGTTGYVSERYVRTVEAATAAAPRQQAKATPKPAPKKAEPAPPEEPAARPPVPGTPLARVEMGMSEGQVRNILGEPTSQNSYMTGKAWIPYYYGSDTSRMDYKYKGVGVVVFGRNRYSGQTRVIRVDYDPAEDGF